VSESNLAHISGEDTSNFLSSVLHFKLTASPKKQSTYRRGNVRKTRTVGLFIENADQHGKNLFGTKVLQDIGYMLLSPDTKTKRVIVHVQDKENARQQTGQHIGGI
jgi:hypothetical protein